jgi:hypothetical protein
VAQFVVNNVYGKTASPIITPIRGVEPFYKEYQSLDTGRDGVDPLVVFVGAL